MHASRQRNEVVNSRLQISYVCTYISSVVLHSELGSIAFVWNVVWMLTEAFFAPQYKRSFSSLHVCVAMPIVKSGT